ncbi:SAM-dependent methyltransferase [Aurantimonas sp. VKM B-3413]|uniref:SAM-dependent methyltransferase n=1 Tax=Aurantimonas sp. VKM B-3413 TaxID=2779401 RepID=UPI001E4B011C|nr:SAM-dependent methyltransferase [Aurantimonas sp. VKM B-3413]MCB8836536.1 SAM-dependent methyltransferase [Aurantimonas sp. VKM B-3413]
MTGNEPAEDPTAARSLRDTAREGEVRFDGPPPAYDDAGLVFIGRIRSPWKTCETCPKNRRAALEAGETGVLEIDPRWRPALAGLAVGDVVWCLTFLDGADRDLALQKPRHSGDVRATFTLRSPARPNPIGLHLARIEAIDPEAGRVTIDAVDVLDGTPLLDIKPYYPSVDAPSAGTSEG